MLLEEVGFVTFNVAKAIQLTWSRTDLESIKRQIVNRVFMFGLQERGHWKPGAVMIASKRFVLLTTDQSDYAIVIPDILLSALQHVEYGERFTIVVFRQLMVLYVSFFLEQEDHMLLDVEFAVTCIQRRSAPLSCQVVVLTDVNATLRDTCGSIVGAGDSCAWD